MYVIHIRRDEESIGTSYCISVIVKSVDETFSKDYVILTHNQQGLKVKTDKSVLNNNF